ncbi:MAG: ThiJ/PfpI domain protein [Firmicutes bacterium]|nr:ThiJ/PfpI domain protein [Bacillota bacterium]
MKNRNILMVVTNHDRIDESHASGLWLEEFVAPYREFKDQGYDITVASPKGGIAPLDKNSLMAERELPPEVVLLQNTTPLAEINPEDYDAIFLTGGHGTMFDFPTSADLKIVIKNFARRGKPISAVCHGVAGLVGIQMEDGKSLVAGRTLTSFTNEEEYMAKLENLVPFMLETRLREQGANHQVAASFTEHVVVDNNLVTGQNPMSSKKAALAVISLLL